MKYCDRKEDMPAAPHFAALVFSTVHIPGDERSRTNPGHGYPAEDKAVAHYIAFESRGEMEAWVKTEETPSQFGGAKTRYSIIEAFPRAVTTSVSVAVG